MDKKSKNTWVQAPTLRNINILLKHSLVFLIEKQPAHCIVQMCRLLFYAELNLLEETIRWHYQQASNAGFGNVKRQISGKAFVD